MGSIWNRVKNGPMADRDQDGEEASIDKDSPRPRALSTLLTSSKENNVNKSQSAPQPTCEEKIHYPIYNPLNPRHNPGVARSRSTIWPARFPITPKSKTGQSPKPGSWAERSPVRSLRKAKSGFLAFTEELRSKPSFCHGDLATKPTTSSTDPVSPPEQASKESGGSNHPEAAEHLSLTISHGKAAPILKLDLAASSQMSLSPFITSPSASSKDETPSPGDATMAPAFSGSSHPPATTIAPRISCSAASFLPLPEVHSHLEDPFQSLSYQSHELQDITKPDNGSDNLTQAAYDVKRNNIPGETATAEGSLPDEIKSCSKSDMEEVSLEKRSLGPAELFSPLAEKTQQDEDFNKCDPANNPKTDNEELQSCSSQSQKFHGKSFESAPGPNQAETKLLAKDDIDTTSVNIAHADSTVAPQGHPAQALPEISDSDPHERLSETSTDEDSDFGVDIYRTMCLGERNPLSDPNSMATAAVWPSPSEDDEKSEELDNLQPSSQDSIIPTTVNTTSIGRQSMDIKQLPSKDSSSQSTVRWGDGYVRHENPSTYFGDWPVKSVRDSKSRDFQMEDNPFTSSMSHTEEVGDSMEPPRREPPASDLQLHSIGTRDDVPLAPCGDMRYDVEAIERMNGLQLTDTSEALSSSTTRESVESTNTSSNTEQILNIGDDERHVNESTGSATQDATSGLDNTEAGEAVLSSPQGSLPSTAFCTSQSEGSTGFDDGLTHKESSSGNSTESSQADTKSDDTVLGKQSIVSSAFGSYAVPGGPRFTNTKAKSLEIRSSRASTDGNDDSSQNICSRIISDGSLHSGPGLDRNAPSSSAQMVRPEALGPGSLHLAGNKNRGSQSDFTGDWSSGSEDCGFGAWKTQSDRHGY